MDIREMNGDPGIWEELSWEDMSDSEKQLWSDLGWKQKDWDGNRPPESADKEWSELNDTERKAALRLGFTKDLWDNFEDE